MRQRWLPFASYNLWSLFAPSVGQELFHCPMKRGFLKARNKEPGIRVLINQDTIPQTVGLLSQYGVYEFYQEPELIESSDGISQVASLINLEKQVPIVQSRVLKVFDNYRSNPVLADKNVLHLLRGDEGPPKPILLSQGSYKFNLYAALDCVFSEPDGSLHILDFKTGKSEFDGRQAYVYLLAAQYLYPGRKSVASFYNLESKQWSKPITASVEQLHAVKIELLRIAHQNQTDLRQYRQCQQSFTQIFPPAPGYPCRSCIFNSICDFSTQVPV